MTAMSTPLAYWIAVALAAAICAALCVGVRRRPGPWTRWAGRILALVLVADAVTFVTNPLVNGTWTARSSIPLDLCDVALGIAAVACWRPGWSLGVELTYFWGLAGTLQAVVTPDLSAGFPHLAFLEFVVGHVGIVIAALFLVVGLRRHPRPGAVWRVLAITVIYTAAVGVVDAATGADYMFLAHRPAHASLLSVLGPWPWYVLSAAGVGVVLLVALDLPFRRGRQASVRPGSDSPSSLSSPPAVGSSA